MSADSSVLRMLTMSVRLSSAVLTAASTSTSWARKVGVSVSSNFIPQKSATFGSKMSCRRASSERVICASATITASSLRATSASASTMSIGAIVPTATRALLSCSDSRAISSDCCCTFMLSTA